MVRIKHMIQILRVIQVIHLNSYNSIHPLQPIEDRSSDFEERCFYGFQNEDACQ